MTRPLKGGYHIQRVAWSLHINFFSVENTGIDAVAIPSILIFLGTETRVFDAWTIKKTVKLLFSKK